jgi:hypothetical protein
MNSATRCAWHWPADTSSLAVLFNMSPAPKGPLNTCNGSPALSQSGGTHLAAQVQLGEGCVRLQALKLGQTATDTACPAMCATPLLYGLCTLSLQCPLSLPALLLLPLLWCSLLFPLTMRCWLLLTLLHRLLLRLSHLCQLCVWEAPACVQPLESGAVAQDICKTEEIKVCVPAVAVAVSAGQERQHHTTPGGSCKACDDGMQSCRTQVIKQP